MDFFNNLGQDIKNMGAIHRFDLQTFVDKYKLENYIETGFGDLTSFNHARKYSFKKFYGVDLDKEWYDKAVSILGNAVILENDYSTGALLKWINFINGNTFWYLDSHFIGSDYRHVPYDQSIITHKRQSLPLEDELCIIFNNRNVSNDVFIIDDFVLYEENLPCEWAQQGHQFQHRDLVKSFNIDLTSKFLYNFFKDSHNIKIDLRDQGYFIATPKNEI